MCPSNFLEDAKKLLGAKATHDSLINLKVTLQKVNTKAIKLEDKLVEEVAKLFTTNKQEIRWKQSYKEAEATTNDLTKQLKSLKEEMDY